MLSNIPPSPPKQKPAGPSKETTKKSKTLRIAVISLVALIIFGIISLRGAAGIYTDYLWFDSLNFSSIWTSIVITRILLALVFFGLFLGLAWANFAIASKVAPKTRPSGPEEDALSKYHSSPIGKRRWITHLLVGGFLALIIGVGANNQWENWLMFVNKSDFGIEDQLHGIDLGFYIFQLPFLLYFVNWLFTSFVVIIIFTLIYHYVYGGIRFKIKNRNRILPPVHAHLSILLGILALIRAVDYFLGRYQLTTSTSGFVDGASYTDINARLPILNLLIVIALISAALFVYNIWRRNWIIPSIAIGLWIFVSITMGSIYPFFIQQFIVSPAESSREQVYIDRNIESTRIAYGLDNVQERTLDINNDKTYEELIEANRDIVSVIPIQDSKRLPQTFENLQGERGFYEFANPLDVDRYIIDGVVTPVVIGSRELNPKDLPNNSWEATRLAFTHGYGLALTPANSTDGGLPNFRIGGLPVENSLENINLQEPRIYVSEQLEEYAIVKTNRKEIDGSDTTLEQGSYTYTGDGGVKIGGFFRQAAFALRFWEIEPLISDFISDDSQIIYIRNIRDRVQKLAPFLYFDNDIYPVLANGRIYYIVDAYTTTNRYPYSQRSGSDLTGTDQLAESSGLRHEFNYVRNSVKAVVDSFDGSVTFYAFDEEDPILRTWRKAFPDLFTDKSEMDQELLDHIRYPEDLFRTQTNAWASYQLSNPLEFYSRGEAWNVAQDPGGVAGAAFTAVENEDGTFSRGQQFRIDPYYTVLRLPLEDEASYVALRPFVPLSDDTRKELTAFMVAKGDAHNYGELILYRTPGGNVDGPAIINSKIQADPGISRIITLLDQQGSNVSFGEMLLVPIEDSILYVRSLYVTAASTEVPELQRVIAVLDDNVVMCSTLSESLEALFDPSRVVSSSSASTDECVGNVGGISEDGEDGETPDTTTTTTVTPETTTTTLTPPTTTTDPDGDLPDPDSTVEELLASAEELFEQADEALRAGDLGRYQELNDQAQNLIAQALAEARQN